MRHGAFRDGAGEALDYLNFVFLPGPATYTGEDMLELFPHGNPLLVARIIEEILNHEACRAAGPGEFTRRRLAVGKMDLLEAEALDALIRAPTAAGLRNSARLLSGGLAESLRRTGEGLAALLAELEAGLDFPEDADTDARRARVLLAGARALLSRLLASWERGRALFHEPRVGIFGPANAGKSSLLNAVLGRERVLVSAEAGTTRDFVEAPLDLPEGRLILIDTAG